ncbi:FAD-dependent oxidoreductase [Bradyrhizobium liaoningense]|uniref:FAD-dependent oxidoreductase n=1 Tax=Bradyrhizobium liaoningense TaxID=43992 RepID=UPI001BA88D6F|nr:FAD-dependent oxidoreductase [Bradyrhizobium liaoningense]
METIDTSVLIVGGGPVGLSLAIDLGWRGIATVLIEQEQPDARRIHPRMDNVGIRSMEFCRRWGIVEAVENAGFPRDVPLSIVYATAVLGHELARDVYPDKANAVAPPFSAQKHELCPQNFFDPVLQRAASSYSTNRLLYGYRFEDFEEKGDRIIASARPVSGGEPLQVRAQYLAACDGANSAIAQRLSLAPAKTKVLSCSTNVFIRCSVLAQRTAACRAYRYLLIGPEGIWGSFVNIDGRDTWRLQLLGDDRWPDWSEAQIHDFVRRGIGADIDYELLSWLPWSRRETTAARFGSGRCFLVGDSAHQLSPTGGYGMNTGIAEAVDLSWKIAARLEGWGGEALLESYDAERRPVAMRNVLQASENLRAMRSLPLEPALLDQTAIGEAARRAIGAYAQQALQREWRSFGIHLGAVYRGSPIIVEETSDRPEPDVANFVQLAVPGGRAPHVWLAPGHSTLDLFGRGFVLLEFSSDSDVAVAALISAARAARMPISHHLITHPDATAAYGRRYVLVRPDGHISWCGDVIPREPAQLIDRVRGVDAVREDYASKPAALASSADGVAL